MKVTGLFKLESTLLMINSLGFGDSISTGYISLMPEALYIAQAHLHACVRTMSPHRRLFLPSSHWKGNRRSCAYVSLACLCQCTVRTFINIFSHGNYKCWGGLNVPFSGGLIGCSALPPNQILEKCGIYIKLNITFDIFVSWHVKNPCQHMTYN